MGVCMGYEIRKTKGGQWAIIETRVVEIRPDKDEAKDFLSALEKDEMSPSSVPFNTIARQSGRYTIYSVIPSQLVQSFHICPGDEINLSLNIALDEEGEDDD